jgi:hypothetical protein
MLRKIMFMLMGATTYVSASAQDSTATAGESCDKKVLSVSGTADLYYRYDFAKTKSNNLTSFTNSHNSFELGMASVKLESNFSKVSMVADIGFGKRAQDFSYNDEGTMAAIKQLFVSYQATDWLKLTMGSWATHVGYELVDPMLNRNYSMSYMFSYGPFSHTGLKAEMTSGNHGFMIGIANPTDYKFVPDEGLNKKFLLAQYSYSASEKFAAYLNYVGGQGLDSSKGNQFDLVVTSKLSDKFGIGFNGTVNSSKAKVDGKFEDAQQWWGSALYLNYDISSKFGLTLRNEYFSDADARLMFSGIDNGGSIFATTLSANFRVGSCFAIIPELRIDNASENIFTDSKGNGTKQAGSAILAAIYTF